MMRFHEQLIMNSGAAENVMPHNLFLHSALVLARDKDTDPSRNQGDDAGSGRGIARNGAARGSHDELKRLNETTDSAKKMESKKKKGFSGLPVTTLQTKLVVFYSGLVSSALDSLSGWRRRIVKLLSNRSS